MTMSGLQSCLLINHHINGSLADSTLFIFGLFVQKAEIVLIKEISRLLCLIILCMLRSNARNFSLLSTWVGSGFTANVFANWSLPQPLFNTSIPHLLSLTILLTTAMHNSALFRQERCQGCMFCNCIALLCCCVCVCFMSKNPEVKSLH